MFEKKLVDRQLDQWLEEQPNSAFPRSIDYKARYRQISNYLAQNVHTDVEKGAILEQIMQDTAPRKIIYLTHHGPGHVDKVIKRASELLTNSRCLLSPYEGYILLTAIQFHDVGNIYGREEHEKKCIAIMRSLGPLAGDDRPEKNAIIKIAASHSGCSDGDKDTIGHLQKDLPLFEDFIRKRFLAAVLRFADELADDRTRASRFILNDGRIPPASAIYHEYSNCLHTVVLHGEEIILRFEIAKPKATKKFLKGKSKGYLLDEIYQRTLKMHQERAYCMRFLRPTVDISRIRISIEVCNDIVTDAFSEALSKIEYCLEEKGYPALPEKEIFKLCPELQGKDGKWLCKELRSNR